MNNQQSMKVIEYLLHFDILLLFGDGFFLKPVLLLNTTHILLIISFTYLL